VSEKSKVIWSEGLFLRPQHFQQQERYLERYVDARVATIARHGYGFSDLEVDRDLLAIGKLALRRARGVFPDGTPFAMPGDDALPTPLDVPANARDRVAYLALPLRRDGAQEIARTADSAYQTRYTLGEWEARDATRETSERVPLEVGSLQTRIVLQGTPIEDFACIPLAQIRECRSDKQVLLEDAHFPTALDASSCPPLARYQVELLGMIKQHADALAQLLVGTRAGGVAEMGDLIRLQTLNRYEPILRHLARMRPVHPEELYGVLVSMCGDLATLSEADRRMPLLPEYAHHDLRLSFEPVMQQLRRYLSDAGPSKVTALEVENLQPGIYRVRVPDPTFFDSAIFYLAASASMPTDALQRDFPSVTTIVPTRRLGEYVKTLLPGIKLTPISHLPPQIPHYGGNVYFELSPNHVTWDELKGAGAFGIHVASPFENLAMRMWAMRK
jgi:type VI secretion system protein ImpJ